jgi:hypothetical protein
MKDFVQDKMNSFRMKKTLPAKSIFPIGYPVEASK